MAEYTALGKALENAGAPSNGTSEVQTITLSSFGACTLTLTFKGASTSVVFAGTENNGAIDTAVLAALIALRTIGTSGVTVSTSGTTDRAIAVTFAAQLGKLDVDALVASVSGGSAVAATLSTNLTGSNNDLTFTAVTAGTAANSVTVSYVDPGTDGALSVGVIGNAITVTLAYATGAITSTAALVRAALIASAGAAALITPTLKSGNDGTGIVTALSATPLAGGLAAPSVAVAITTPGVTATGRNQGGCGQLLIDSTNGKLFINTGTAPAPAWTVVGSQS